MTIKVVKIATKVNAVVALCFDNFFQFALVFNAQHNFATNLFNSAYSCKVQVNGFCILTDEVWRNAMVFGQFCHLDELCFAIVYIVDKFFKTINSIGVFVIQVVNQQ